MPAPQGAPAPTQPIRRCRHALVRAGIVGCGFIASPYADTIHTSPQLDLVATVDRVLEHAQRLAQQHGCTPYESLPDLLAQSDAELIVNLTPPLAHADVTRTCLAAAKHFYSEKPLAMRHDEAQALVAEAQRHGVHLACAPNNLYGDAQQVAWRLVCEGRLGTVCVVYADCHIGRVTQWHPNPESLIRSGPLFDGAVYPLTLLTAYFGPVVQVISAHSLNLGGGSVRRCRFHDRATPEPRPSDPCLPVPLPRQAAPRHYASAIADLAEAHCLGRPPDGQAAHLVEVINAITTCAETAQAVPVHSRFAPPSPLAWSSGLWPVSPLPQPPRGLPAIGFGCSRYRGGSVYVDLEGPIEDALDMGYRLFDTAELYGNERQLGEIVRRPGSPRRQELFLVSKVWNTNHAYAHVLAACEKTLRELGLSYLDLYLIHWPHAWQYRGPLEQLMTRSHAEALTFPQDEAGNIMTADVPLEETWRAMETLVARGGVRAIGVNNFDREHLETVLASATVPPAVNQIEYHPYLRNDALVAWCQAQDIAMMAHSPGHGALLNDTTQQASARMGTRPGKGHLPTKTCMFCGRPFAWRKKWFRHWEEVRYCSQQCRRLSKQGQTQ